MEGVGRILKGKGEYCGFFYAFVRGFQGLVLTGRSALRLVTASLREIIWILRALCWELENFEVGEIICYWL